MKNVFYRTVGFSQEERCGVIFHHGRRRQLLPCAEQQLLCVENTQKSNNLVSQCSESHRGSSIVFFVCSQTEHIADVFFVKVLEVKIAALYDHNTLSRSKLSWLQYTMLNALIF